MIPYFQITNFQLGQIPIQAWGTMVALGILIGTWVSAKRAKKLGLDQVMIWDAAAWVLIGAFLAARLFHVLFYDLAYYASDPVAVLRVWEGGFSITGGFIGALIAGLIFVRVKKIKFWDYIDAAVFGLPLGLFIGRIGCFLIHDHPGSVTDFFLGVKYPDSLIRHDHGLYLSLNGLFLFLLFLILSKKKLGQGMYAAIFLLWYGIVRFALDFIRATDGAIIDQRYLGLTPAQYGAILMVGVGVWVIIRSRKLSAKK